MMIKIDCDQLRKLYTEDRLTFKAIGGIFNCTKQTIMKKAKECNVKSRSRWDFPHKRGINHPLWKGGYTTKAGYVRVRLPDNSQKFEHVIVWENYFGKPKPAGCEIHHLNGVRTDNRIENLLLLRKAKHSKLGDVEYYQKRIRQLEVENKKLRGQMNLL